MESVKSEVKKLIFMLLALSSAKAIELNRNGTIFHHDGRIIGGQQSSQVIPYISVIEEYLDGAYEPTCFGTIISSRSILTYGMCAQTCKFITGCKVFVGRLYVGFGGQQLHLLDAAWPSSNEMEIGILRVRKISFSQDVQSISLPTQDLIQETEAIIVGRGSKNGVFIFFLVIH